MVMQFNQCCCGCTLRTGSIIIGVLGLLSGIYMAIQGISGATAVHEVSNQNTIPTLNPNFDTSNSTGNGSIAGVAGFHIVQVIIGFVEIIICVMLLIGITKNSPKLIYPWIIVSWIIVVLNVIVVLGMGIIYCVAGLVAIGAIVIIVGAIAILISVYFILIVNSYHISLKSGPVSRA